VLGADLAAAILNLLLDLLELLLGQG